MNRVIAALKKIRLGQILMAFVAGVLLFVSTACSNGGTPTVQAKNTRQEVPAGLQPNTGVPAKENPRPEVPENAETSRFQGSSMNEFSDIDPRAGQDAARAAEKAEALRENAELNVIDETGNIGETTKRILDKKGENVEDVGRNLRESVEGTKEQAQDTTENLRLSTKEATRDLTRSANRAGENVNQTVKANAPDAENLTRGAKQATENVTENTKAAGTNLVDKAQQAIEKAGEFVQGNANQAAKGTQRSLYKAGDAVGETVDD